MTSMLTRCFVAAGLIAGVTLPARADTSCVDCYAREVRPALFTNVDRRVVVHRGHIVAERIPARYHRVDTLIEVRPARIVQRRVAAEVRVTSEPVLVAPAHKEWRTTIDAHGRRVLCEVVVPARYADVRHEVVVAPERVVDVTLPAEYRVVSHRVLTRPAQIVYHRTASEVHHVPTLVEVRPETVRWVPTSDPSYEPASAALGRW